MSLRLSMKDIELIKFIGKYKKLKAVDCKKIYRGEDYSRKRLKVLENEKYIRREKRYYIKIDIEGRKLLKTIGYKDYNICRNKEYKERLNNIIKIAMLSLESEIEFIPSWELKDKKVYTELGRKYIGELKYRNVKYVTYYISNKNNSLYVKQIRNDIEKLWNCDNIIIFSEKVNIINESNIYFICGKNSVKIINPTEENLETMKLLQDIDIYEILNIIYRENKILLTDLNVADYMTEDKYIISMPFIDTEKLHRINILYNSNKSIDKKIVIVTLKENVQKVKEILKKETEILELDDWIKKYISMVEEQKRELKNLINSL